MISLFRQQSAQFISKSGETEYSLFSHTTPEDRPAIPGQRTVGGDDDDGRFRILPDVTYLLKHSLADPRR